MRVFSIRTVVGDIETPGFKPLIHQQVNRLASHNPQPRSEVSCGAVCFLTDL